MNNRHALISKILKFSMVDGPGNRLVIFFQGCNFNCPSCHNPQTINLCNDCGDCIATCPSDALSFVKKDGVNKVSYNSELCTHCDLCTDNCLINSSPKTKSHSISSLIKIIEENKAFLSGVTVTGGESTLNLGFIIDLFKTIKGSATLKDLTCMVDSNGSLSQTGWEKLIPVMDGAMIDLKAFNEKDHLLLTGKKPNRVFQTLDFLASKNRLYEVRLLFIPNKSFRDCELPKLANYLKSLPSNVRIKINPFATHGVKGEAIYWDPCSLEQLNTFKDKLVALGLKKPVLILNMLIP